MKKFKFLITFLIITLSSSLFADSIFLKNGEVIKGKIIEVNGEVITISSELGYGEINILREQIIAVTFPENTKVDLARRYGLGYLSKTPATSSNDRYYYRVNQVSFRTYPNTNYFLDFLFGYSSGKVTNITTNTSSDFSVMQTDIRLAYVLSRLSQLSTYTGVGVGYLYWKDPLLGTNEGGVEGQFFVGIEVSFEVLPSLGFSGELSVNFQKSKSLDRQDLAITALPTLAVHYYF